MAGRRAAGPGREGRGGRTRAWPRALACALAAAAALGAAAAAPAGTGATAAGLIVAFAPETPPAERDAAVAAAGAEPAEAIDELGAVVAAAPADRAAAALEALRGDPRVRWAELDGVARSMAEPSDPGYAAARWVYERTELPGAWTATTGSPSVVVAVLDSGVDAGHPDLVGAIVPGTSLVGGSTTDTSDLLGHGTQVAGTVAARLNGAGAVGACPSCAVMPVRVLDASDRALWSDVASGIVWAADRGADVVNVSLAGTSGSEAVRAAIGYAAGRGVLVVIAAGNASSTDPSACGPSGCGGYPAAYAAAEPAALSVAATGPDDALASFSNRGASWVELAAPGCVHTTSRGGGTGPACGTSFAAPLVAGAAGLLLAHEPSLSASQLAAALTSAADRLPGLDVASGRLDAYAALRAVGYEGGPPASTVPPAVAGTAREGDPLTAAAGSWSGEPTSLAVAWERCDASGAACAATGAGGATYVPSAADVGSTLRVAVTAANAAGSTTARSAPTAVVGARAQAAPPAPAPPAPAPAPAGSSAAGGGAVPVDAAVLVTATPARGAPGGTTTIRARASLRPGSGPAQRAVLTVTLPEGARVAEARATRGPGCAAAGRVVACDLDGLPAGAAAEIVVTAVAGGSGPLAAEARLETAPVDARAEDNTATAAVEVSAAPARSGASAGRTARRAARPTLRGTAKVGRVVSVLPGRGWREAGPHSFAVRWQRCRPHAGGLACVTLGARRGRTVRLVGTDLGARLRAVVVALAADGRRERRLSRTTPVVTGPPARLTAAASRRR